MEATRLGATGTGPDDRPLPRTALAGGVSMKTVLVTGGAGYIGSHTCKELDSAGYSPVVYDDLSQGHRWAVRYGPLIEGDVADTQRLTDILRETNAGAVIHFAASACVGESMRDPQKYFRNNVAGTIGLLDAVRAA